MMSIKYADTEEVSPTVFVFVLPDISKLDLHHSAQTHNIDNKLDCARNTEALY